MSYGHIKTWLDDIDQRRQRAEPPQRRCPACGEYLDDDEFDDAGADYQAEHLALLRAHFGGLPCHSCCDTFDTCERCGQVHDRADLPDGYCAICASRFNLYHGRRPVEID